MFPLLLSLLSLLPRAFAGSEYYTFDGEGSPSCHNVVEVHNATSVDHAISLVQDAKARGLQVRASAKGHMWYDTMCSDDETVVIRTEYLNDIWDFDIEAGEVWIGSGVTFFQWVTSSLWGCGRVGADTVQAVGMAA